MIVAETPAGGSGRGAAVLAAGGALAGQTGMRRRLTLTSSHMVITEPVGDLLEEIGWTGRECITDSRAMVHYFRTTPDGRIAFGWGGGRIVRGHRTGGRAEVDPEITRARAPPDPLLPRPAGSPHRARLGRADRRLAHAPADDSRASSRESLAGFGYTGHGVGPSHMIGRSLASLALDRDDEASRLAIVSPPPHHVPPEPFRFIGGSLIRRAIVAKETADEQGRAPSRLSRTLAAIPARIGIHIGRSADRPRAGIGAPSISCLPFVVGAVAYLAEVAFEDWPHIHALLDMDAFYVAVELRRRPELRGRPVIVAGSGPRAVVTTASYEARPYGVGSAIPVAHAKRRCPDLIHLPVDMAHYRGRSLEVMALVDELEVPTQPVSLDEVYLDLSGLTDPVARMSGLVRTIRERLGLDASVGIGPNKLVAKVASDAEKPRGFVVLTREQAATRFAGEPPRMIPGIGPKTAERLRAIGVATIGDLQRVAAEDLVARFGRSHGSALHERAHFRDDAPVARGEAKSRSVETTFDTTLRPVAARAVADRSGRAARGGAPQTRDRRADDRDQGPPRRLDHGHPGALGRDADQRPGADRRDGEVAAPRLRAAAAGSPARRPRSRVRRPGYGADRRRRAR